jgi:putative membrane protein
MLTRGFGGMSSFCRGFGYMHPGVWVALAGVFVAALVVIIVLIARKKHHGASDSTAEALKLRYIKGELTEEEYTKMKDVIGK